VEGDFNPNLDAGRKMGENAQPASFQTDVDEVACYPGAMVQEEDGRLFIQRVPGMSATFQCICRLAVSGPFDFHGRLPGRDKVKPVKLLIGRFDAVLNQPGRSVK